MNIKQKLVEKLNSESPNKEELLYVLAPASFREAQNFILNVRTKGLIAAEFYSDQIVFYSQRNGLDLHNGELEIYVVEGYGNYNIVPKISLFGGDTV